MHACHARAKALCRRTRATPQPRGATTARVHRPRISRMHRVRTQTVSVGCSLPSGSSRCAARQCRRCTPRKASCGVRSARVPIRTTRPQLGSQLLPRSLTCSTTSAGSLQVSVHAPTDPCLVDAKADACAWNRTCVRAQPRAPCHTHTPVHMRPAPWTARLITRPPRPPSPLPRPCPIPLPRPRGMGLNAQAAMSGLSQMR